MISQKTDNHNNRDSLRINNILQKVDSIKYSELDFDKMKKYYSENTELNRLISKKASDGDKDAVDFLEILTLSYNKASEKYGKNEIKGMIYIYHKTVAMKEKFDRLNKNLDLQIDSLQLQNERYKKAIEKDRKIIDSLKNN